MEKGKKDIKNNSRIKSEVITRQVLKVAHDDWNTEAFSIDRTALEGKKIPTLNEFYTYDCIYFLVGNNDFNGKPDIIERVYVGQAGPRNNGKGVLQRLKEHDRKLEERYHAVWDFAVVVANKENKWGSTELDQIEHIFYNLIPKEHNLNGNNPNSDGLSSLEDYEDIINQIKAYLHYFSVNTFADEENLNKQTIEEVLQEKDDRRVEDLQKGMAKIPEIVTPLSVVKQIVDILPDNVWNSKTVFLDPACKGGEFLREIYDRLMKTESLVAEFPNEIERAFHILEKQIFGIALSETSRTRAVRKLNGYDKNIIVIPFYIDILKSKTRECAVNGKVVSFKEKLAYEFGRENMNFDVVIGNPPYQEMDGSGNCGGTALYHLFIDMADEIGEKFSFIIPSRWISDNPRGIGEAWKIKMRTRKDFVYLKELSDSSQMFGGVSIAGGVCYFLVDREFSGNASITYVDRSGTQTTRVGTLGKDGVVIRNVEVDSIVGKILNKNPGYIHNMEFANMLGTSRTFSKSKGAGLTNYLESNWDGFSDTETKECYIKFFTNKRLLLPGMIHGYVSEENLAPGTLVDAQKYNLFLVASAGEYIKPPIIGGYNSCCSTTYIPMHSDKISTETEAKHLIKYFKTKFFRLLCNELRTTQHVSKSTFQLVPMQDFTSSSDIDWSKSISEIDQQLYKKYNLTPEEIAYIEKTIKAME